MMEFEQALACGGKLVAAWDFADDERTWMKLYNTESGGAKLISAKDVPHAAHEEMVDGLIERGVRIGATYNPKPFVWVADDSGYAVWSSDRLIASGAPSPSAASVQVFLDPMDRGHRGVRLNFKSGRSELIAEERSDWPNANPTYGQDDLYYDTFWAHYLGEQLAVFHLVPLQNDIQPADISADLLIANVAKAFARRVDWLPASGIFQPLIVSLGSVRRASELSLLAACDPENPALRTLGVRVVSPSGRTTSDQFIKRGTNGQIAGFLRRVSSPAAIQFAMNDLISKQNSAEGLP